jgi:cation diffusion facilitator family transporter
VAQNGRSSLTRYAFLSIFAAVTTISMKSIAYWLTGSVGLLSDALESIVNLVAAAFTMVMLVVAARPPDEDHRYGHDKVEYFSSALEGVLILVAAVSIAAAAITRLLNPQPLEQIGLGLAVTLAASVVNLIVARVLLRAGRHANSIALEADGQHLMTDVWTSVAVVIGVAFVGPTGWSWLDPVVALAASAHIASTAIRLIRRSALGLMDTALDLEQQRTLDEALQPFRNEGVQFHALRTRQSGGRSFVSFHVLVPGVWTVSAGHLMLERIEAAVRQHIANVTVFTHLEPLEDPAAFDDIGLHRESAA